MINTLLFQLLAPSTLFYSAQTFVSSLSKEQTVLTADPKFPHVNEIFSNGQAGPLLGSYIGLPHNATFDYVVVGGGTAGLAMASRLAADGSNSVAVIEAGGFYELDNGNVSVVPGYATYYAGMDPSNFQPLVDWGMNTVAQPQLGGRIVHYARGKTLGGSSARNYMFYQRPNNGSLQKWADEVGDQDYAPENIFPFFKRSVNVTGNNQIYTNTSAPQDDAAYEPRGGPVQLSFGSYMDGWSSWVAEAYRGIGLQLIDGFTNGKLMGYGFSVSSIDLSTGQRSSSTAFLHNDIRRGRAPKIYKNTLAEKIIFDEHKTATGVNCFVAGTFGTPGLNFTLTARKEVILSAGVFQSPQLLMVSGIGDKNELAQHGIRSIVDLPGVGKNMWDHVMFGTIRAVNLATTARRHMNADAVQQYITDGTGPLSTFSSSPYGWEKLPAPYRDNLSDATRAALDDHSFVTPDWPELEWLPAAAYGGYSLNPQIGAPDDGNYATLKTGLMAPLSRGAVSLASASMHDLPQIDPAWFSHPADKDLAIAAFRRTREAWDVLAKAGIAHKEEALPGLNVTTDEQIWSFIQQSFSTIWHASSTCKMGKVSDRMAVVDSRSKVFGVQALRIVDASALPFMPPGHPLATIYALAEKIADDILHAE